MASKLNLIFTKQVKNNVNQNMEIFFSQVENSK